jgi:hypothetical protein
MGKWASKAGAINVGDTVAYSKTFLQSTGQYTGDVPHAEIEWNKPDLPRRVHVKNLSTKKQIQMGE